MFIIVKTEKTEKFIGERISRLWCMSYQLKRWSSIYMDPIWKFLMKSLSDEASFSLLLCVCVYVHICKVWSHLFQKLIKQNNDLLIFVYVTTWKKSWREGPPLGCCPSEMWLGGAGWRGTFTCTVLMFESAFMEKALSEGVYSVLCMQLELHYKESKNELFRGHASS